MLVSSGMNGGHDVQCVLGTHTAGDGRSEATGHRVTAMRHSGFVYRYICRWPLRSRPPLLAISARVPALARSSAS